MTDVRHMTLNSCHDINCSGLIGWLHLVIKNIHQAHHVVSQSWVLLVDYFLNQLQTDWCFFCRLPYVTRFVKPFATLFLALFHAHDSHLLFQINGLNWAIHTLGWSLKKINWQCLTVESLSDWAHLNTFLAKVAVENCNVKNKPWITVFTRI